MCCIHTLWVLVMCWLLKVNCFLYESNITDFSKCKVHYSRNEATFTNFFQITDKFRTNNSLVFDFHFAVLAPRDAHILIAPSSQLQRSDPVYEIVLGAGVNSFSDIRRLQKSTVKATARTKNIVSALDVNAFWIHISKEGLIEVGREGEELSFLTWKDPDPLPLKVFSFCTWPGVEAKWFYDCEREDGSSSNSEEIKPNLTDTQLLRKHLLTGYDPYVRPVLNDEDLTIIDMLLTYDRVILDEIKSTMTVHGTMQLKWCDEKLFWNASDYRNIDVLHVFFREIWQPNLILFNSASGPGTDFLQSTYMLVSSDGWVTWHAHVYNMEVWCDASGFAHWPADIHMCEVQIGFLSQQHKFIIKTTLESNPKFSDWTVLEASAGVYLIIKPWTTEEDADDSTYAIKFKLQRNSGPFTAIYFAPFIAISISMLVNFFVSPIGPYKICLNCLQLIVLALVLTSFGLKIPPHHSAVPYLIQIYCYAMLAALFSLTFSITIINWTRINQTTPLPRFLCKILSSYYLQSVLFLRYSKSADSYGNLITENSDTNGLEIQDMWIILGKTIERILFIIYFLNIVPVLFSSY